MRDSKGEPLGRGGGEERHAGVEYCKRRDGVLAAFEVGGVSEILLLGCALTGARGRLNPRLRFLRYGEGQFFAPHCDALYEEPGPEGLKSYLTVHVYLNDEGLEGGATRFWTPDRTMFLDVEPRMGQVLVFQQRMLLHSGEEVRGGLKYTLRADCLFEKIIVTREDRKRAELEADSKLAVGENKVVEVTNKKAEAVVVAEAEAETEAAAGA